MSTAKPMFAGDCAGVDLEARGDKDRHIMFTVCVEDDDQWLRKVSLSSAWIDDLIEQLEEARKLIKSHDPDMFEGRQYGFKFR